MTSLVRFSPTTEIRRMQREIDRLFDDLMPTGNHNADDQETAVWTPRVDLLERDDAYVVHVDAPGMTKDAISINWQDGTLTLSGERTWKNENEKETFVRVERSYGHFFRSFRLPKAVDGNNITASYDAGVLTISIPKTEESRPRRIEVK